MSKVIGTLTMLAILSVAYFGVFSFINRVNRSNCTDLEWVSEQVPNNAKVTGHGLKGDVCWISFEYGARYFLLRIEGSETSMAAVN